jgi:glycosyl hydrolase family 109/GFO/IDH/MocA oxidoreductase family protein
VKPGEEAKLSRRELLRTAGLAGIGVATSSVAEAYSSAAEAAQARRSQHQTMIGVRFEPHDVVRLGIIGVGLRGTEVLREFLAVEKVVVNAVCDVVKEKCVRASQLVEKAGQKIPGIYADGERDFERLVARDDIDFVYIATPWEWHVPQVLAALRAGKHVGTEVPAAYTLEDCWNIVEASERARRHCLIMENCCYDDSETTVLNMVRAGVFGDLVHGECAYNHDLREILFENRDEGLWRRRHHTLRDSNLYPTHGLGPMAQYMDINRGDRFDHIVSMSSTHLGLEAYRKDHVPPGDPKWKEIYKTGDYNTSIIKTAKGRTIMLQHNVSTPRPYDRINLIQGTKGIFRDYPPRIFIEGQAGGHTWTSLDKYKEQFESPLWKNQGEMARKLGGHGGMDYLMCYRLIQCMREGLEPDIDVYDAAAWSVPGPLSQISVAKGSMPVKFPDFTRGLWQHNRRAVTPTAIAERIPA